MIKDFIIIGAGLSGISTANIIKNLNLGSLLVLDKSRGIGGRMATRRTLSTKFDHGAQFYKLKQDISKQHNEWNQKELTHLWFDSNQIGHWCSKNGMTALPKSMLDNLEILLEKQITSIKYHNNIWRLISDKNEEWECRNLVITSPLPQSIKLLETIKDEDEMMSSSKKLLTELKNITYTKALVALLTLEEDVSFSPNGYQEFQSGDFFSISDQKMKGLSNISALTVTMSPEFSELEFENEDLLVLNKITKSLESYFPNLKIKEIELKKWRYCKPVTTYNNLFLEIYPQLYLIGDAFGGASLSGSLRSSNALGKTLLEKSQGPL